MPRTTRLVAGLVSGAVAITLNTLALKAADRVPLATAHGGLLRFIRRSVPHTFRAFAHVWGRLGGPAVGSATFQTIFHVFVGFLMALFYAYALEPVLRGGALMKGLIYAGVMWFLNAFWILPATGEGVAGSAHLTLAGMAWFAAAHTLFFVVLALLYAWMLRRR